MRQKMNSMRGFTLIEVLVSLAIFSFGMLGVAYLTARSVNLSADNTVHSSALQVARQFVEPLHESLRVSRAQFKQQLDKFSLGAKYNTFFATTDNITKDFKIIIVSAVDDLGLSLAGTGDPATWQPPLYLRVDIQVDANLTFQTSHILVPL
ncbi:MAG: prepilin-type N-terminal cleavage/methylation domain-containing protein [Gammaproteobacteria bacterium]|nr:prepilin-type N-terminal cleavage/methylation domain-containing protein [Gammaproteobacteria bacterium]